MSHLAGPIRPLWQCALMLVAWLMDVTRFLRLCLRPSAALAAENLFLRKQLALYQARNVKPRRATAATRLTLVWLAQWFDWHPALVVVQPETFQRWRRQGHQPFWRGISCPGRPPIPVELQRLIQQMARDNCTWGQRRIANELLLKLGLRVSPRTVRKYMPTYRDRVPGHRMPSQRWRTFLYNHARYLVVSDMATDLFTRGVRAVSVRIRRCLRRWWDRPVAKRVQESAPHNAVALALPGDTRAVPAVWSPGIVEVIREDDRSPPDLRPPRHHNPCTVARATPVGTLILRPAGCASGWWSRVSARARSGKLLYTSASQAAPVQRAA
jgi:hypothetical protein